jgi:hypothetical protein
MPSKRNDDNEVPSGGGSAANVATSRVLKGDWAKFELGPYEQLPSDREAVMDAYLMQRYDPTAGAALTFIKQLILSHLGSYSHEDERIQEFVTTALAGIQGGLRQTVSSLLSALWSGFAVGEIIWETGSTWRVKAVEMLHPMTFWDRYDGKPGIEYDRAAGRVSRVRQMRWQDSQEQLLEYPVEQVVYWPFMRELREEVYGKRLSDRARRSWHMRAKIETYWGVFLKRFAHPTPVFRVPKGHQPDPVTGELIPNAEYYGKFIQKMAAGNGVAIEAGPQDVFAFDLLESKGGDAAYETGTRYHNREVWKSFLMSPMIIEEPEHGTRAQAGTSLDALTTLIEAIHTELDEVLVQQLARPMVAYNFGPNVPPGDWSAVPLDEDDLEMLSRTLETLNRAGAVDMTESDERSVREKFRSTGLVALDEIPDDERQVAQEAARQAPAGFGL